MLHFISHARDLENSLRPSTRNWPGEAVSKDARRWPFRVTEAAASPEFPAMPVGDVRAVTLSGAFVT